MRPRPAVSRSNTVFCSAVSVSGGISRMRFMGRASVGWSRHPTRASRFLRGFDHLLLDHNKAERQGAGAYAGREIACLLDREIAGDLARAAEDGLADDGGRDDLVVEHDRE